MIQETPPQPKSRHIKHEESTLQERCFQWAWDALPETRRLLFTIMNENERMDSNAIQGLKRRQKGVVAGVSDMLMLIPNKHYHGLCIELKTPVGKQRDMQAVWEHLVTKQGYKYMIVRTLEDFQKLVQDYLADSK